MGGWNVAVATIVANLIGGCIFFWVDRWIFKDKKSNFKEDDEATGVSAMATVLVGESEEK